MKQRCSPSQDHHRPVRYEIRLQGHLDNAWSDWFEEMAIIREDNGETHLVGPVADQAALHGLLKKIRDIGIALISVTPVTNQPGPTPAEKSGKE